MKKNRLKDLTEKQIEQITLKTEKRNDVPLIKSQQINMRLKIDTLEKVKKLAAAQGIPYTSFLTRLIREDIARLWEVFKKAD